MMIVEGAQTLIILFLRQISVYKQFNNMAKKVKNNKLQKPQISNVQAPKALSAFQKHANLIVQRKSKALRNKKEIANRMSSQNKHNKLADLRMMKPKKVKFNLNDDEDDKNNQELLFTHKGKKIEQIQQFQDVISVSGSEMDDELIQNTHFGGFNEEQEKGNEQRKQKNYKSKKQIYEQIIAKSKMHKFVKQKQHEDNFQKAVALDEEFPQMVKSLQFRKQDRRFYQKNNQDNDYDALLNDLKDDIRVECVKEINPENAKKKQESKRKAKKAEYMKQLEQDSDEIDVRGWAKDAAASQQQSEHDEIDDVELSSEDQQEQYEGQQGQQSQGQKDAQQAQQSAQLYDNGNEEQF